MGKVKTRLAKDIGESAAVKIHEHLARHCLRQLAGFALAPIELWCAPDTSHDFFLRCQSNFNVTLKQQVGDDLGQRMQHALAGTLNNHKPVLLVGTDCPGFTADYLRAAFFSASKNKTGIGPAEDGGYVLLAVNKVQPKIFNNMEWGTSRVYAETVSRLAGDIEELPPLWDVDHVEDLQRLRAAKDKFYLDDEFRTYLESLHSL